MELNCVWCGRYFEAQRRSAKYCSDACKTAQHRYDPKRQIEEHLQAALGHMRQIENILKKDKDMHLPGYDALNCIATIADYHCPLRDSWWWDRSTGRKVQGRFPDNEYRHEHELWQLLDTH